MRNSEEEVRDILADRQKEELASELAISVYDTERNEKAKKHRKELVRALLSLLSRVYKETDKEYFLRLRVYSMQINASLALTVLFKFSPKLYKVHFSYLRNKCFLFKSPLLSFRQERLALEEKKRRQEMEMDYLAPFLAQIGNPEKISKQQAFKLKEDCLADLKQRLIDKANLIQRRFELVRSPSGTFFKSITSCLSMENSMFFFGRIKATGLWRGSAKSSSSWKRLVVGFHMNCD